MATSGTVTFRPKVEEIVREAFERCEKDPQTLTGYHVRSARRSLNLLFVEWAVRGVNFWKVEAKTLSLVSGTSSYALPAGTLDILEASIRRSGTDTPLSRISLDTYQSYPTKTTQGLPSTFFFDRQYTPQIYLWPVPENSTDTVEYWSVSQQDDITAANQDADAPYRWLEAMCAGLAGKLALKYNKPLFDLLETQAEKKFKEAGDDERERATLKIIPPSVS